MENQKHQVISSTLKLTMPVAVSKDNYPAHPHIKNLKTAELIILPPNTTSTKSTNESRGYMSINRNSLFVICQLTFIDLAKKVENLIILIQCLFWLSPGMLYVLA